MTEEQTEVLIAIQRAARRLVTTLPDLDPDSAANAWLYTLGGLLRRWDGLAERAR